MLSVTVTSRSVFLTNIIQARWAEHLARTGREVHTGFWKKLKERDHVEDL
jgi:hypothetical protein